MTSHKRMRPLLGTFVEIGASASPEAEYAVSAAFAIVERLHGLLSFHERGSDLTRLNQAAGEEVEVQPQVSRVLKLAKGMTAASGGLFNCTLGGAMVQQGALPDHDGNEVLLSGDADDIEIRGNRVRLRRRVKITLDGIAKGYAVDCAIASLKQAGVKSGWVNAGGDLRVFGDMVLPVQRREADGQVVELGRLRDAAMASSLVSVAPDPNFPGHVIGTGRSPRLGVWSVMAHRAWRADALTKVASLAPDATRETLLNRLGGVLVSPPEALQ